MSSDAVALLADGALILRVDPTLAAAVADWIPRYRSAGHLQAADEQALLSIEPAGSVQVPAAVDHDGESPTLTLGGVRAHVSRDDVWLCGSSGLRGHVDLPRMRATVAFDPEQGAADVHGGLTLASAFLIGRLGRSLVHAATVVDPRGRGWLLAGDSHSGKTTTCATLVAAGWQYVADDQIVLGDSPNGLIVEGWPREAHLDAGWHDGRLTATRVGADLAALRPRAWAPSAPLHGVWFTNVTAGQPTALTPIVPADALGRLIRQSPWLLADREVAPRTLALLSRATEASCAQLSLGSDSYANGDRLVRCLQLATEAG